MEILVNLGVACLKRPETGAAQHAGTKIALCYGVRMAHREPLGKNKQRVHLCTSKNATS